jgi:hypothetical protein
MSPMIFWHQAYSDKFFFQLNNHKSAPVSVLESELVWTPEIDYSYNYSLWLGPPVPRGEQRLKEDASASCSIF